MGNPRGFLEGEAREAARACGRRARRGLRASSSSSRRRTSCARRRRAAWTAGSRSATRAVRSATSSPSSTTSCTAAAWPMRCASLHATNNFPEVTGRICPAPCEASCVLAIDNVPVTIKDVERSIGRAAIEEGLGGGLDPVLAPMRTGKKVAVVGSGPAGLAAAQQLARAGHDVVVFERDDRLGGLLRYGIPDFKMEKGIIDLRIEQMRAEGVHLRMQRRRGRHARGLGLRRGAARPLRRGRSLPRRAHAARSRRPRSRARRRVLRDGLPRAAESSRRRRSRGARRRPRRHRRHGQARRRDRRRRHRLRLRRHVESPAARRASRSSSSCPSRRSCACRRTRGRRGRSSSARRRRKKRAASATSR